MMENAKLGCRPLWVLRTGERGDALAAAGRGPVGAGAARVLSTHDVVVPVAGEKIGAGIVPGRPGAVVPAARRGDDRSVDAKDREESADDVVRRGGATRCRR